MKPENLEDWLCYPDGLFRLLADPEAVQFQHLGDLTFPTIPFEVAWQDQIIPIESEDQIILLANLDGVTNSHNQAADHALKVLQEFQIHLGDDYQEAMTHWIFHQFEEVISIFKRNKMGVAFSFEDGTTIGQITNDETRNPGKTRVSNYLSNDDTDFLLAN